MNNFGAQNMVSTLKKVLMKKPQKFISEVDTKKWNYISPLDQEIINKNYNEFYEIMNNSDVEIIKLKLENENEELCDSMFTHDPSLVLNEGAIILNMGKKLRKRETEEHIQLYNSLGIPIIGEVINEGTVEGGDCLWINNKTLLVGESLRTNKLGINQLKKIVTNLNIKLFPITLPRIKNENSCFHLMSIISMLDHDLAIGYEKLLSYEVLQLLKINGIKLIKIPEDEFINSKSLAVNILALSPRNLVAINGYPQTIDLLHNEGCKVNLFEGGEICIKTEGGPTCLTRAILRS